MQAQRPGDILIVDADEAFSAQATQTLAQQGHMVMTCRTGAEARRHLERMPYDAVLCGWRLPDEEGIHFCEFVKGQPEMPHVAVALLIDATADDMWVAKLYIGSQDGQSNLGPDELILRSAHMQEVAARVQALLHVRRYRQEIDNALETLMSVAEGVEEQDRRARGHCKRLSIMCIELGAVLGLSEWELTALERAAYLHDIGKVAIPGAIISKVDSLTPREMEIIKNHCVLGEKLCRSMAALKPVLPIIRHHHERANGTGYPDGLKGDEIPVLAQIFSIPDIYDALRMWRPYRTSMSEAQAIQVMRQEVAQGFWNAHFFEIFTKHVLPGLDERLDMAHVLWPSY
jgi:putative two-component system response regulator